MSYLLTYGVQLCWLFEVIRGTFSSELRHLQIFASASAIAPPLAFHPPRQSDTRHTPGTRIQDAHRILSLFFSP